MKKLNSFALFDAEAFFKDKVLMVMKSEDLVDFDSQAVIGAKYTVVIWEDHTRYDKPNISNAGETFSVKIKGGTPKTINSPTPVDLVNPVGSIFGEYRNQLSVSADDVVPTGGED